MTKLATTIRLDEPFYIVTVFETTTVTGTVTDQNSNPVANRQVNVKINTHNTTVTTDSEGKFAYTYAPMDVFESTVTVSIDEDDRYLGSSANALFDSEPISTTITVDNDYYTSTINDTVVITGKLLDEYGKGINGAVITVSVNGIEYNAITDNDGSYRVEAVSPAKAASYDIDIDYKGNGIYIMSSYRATLDVEIMGTTLTIDDIGNAKINDTVQVTGLLLDEKKNPMANMQVHVIINDDRCTATTSSCGRYSINYTVASPVDHRIDASFDGMTDVYAGSSSSNSFTAEKLATAIKLDKTSYTANMGDEIAVTGTLADENNKPLDGVMVTMAIGDYTATASTVNGAFAFRYTPMSMYKGSVIVSIQENDYYLSSRAISDYSCESIYTAISLDNNYTAIINGTFTVTGKLNDQTGNPLANAEVILVLNNKQYVASTDNNGVFNASLVAPGTAGNYSISAEFAGNESHISSITECVVNVGKMPVNIAADNIACQYLDSIKLVATVADINGNRVTGGKVAFKINGNMIKDSQGNAMYANVESGIAKLDYNITLNPKTYTIKALFYGDRTYDSTSSQDSKMVVKNREVTNAILPITGDLKAGQTIEITSLVYDSEGRTVKDGTVIFKMNNVTLKDSNGNPIKTAVRNGTATLKYTIPVDMAQGTYTINSVYSNKNYERGETATRIHLIKSNVTANIKPVIVSSGENATLSAVLYDQNGHQLQRSTKVSVKLNGKTLATTTTAKGTLNITLKTDTFRNPYYNLTVIFGENSAYNQLVWNTTLIIA